MCIYICTHTYLHSQGLMFIKWYLVHWYIFPLLSCTWKSKCSVTSIYTTVRLLQGVGQFMDVDSEP